jgi:hypothetical protein
MGMAAARRLLAQILDGVTFNEPVIMPVSLVVRSSTGKPPKHVRTPAVTAHAPLAHGPAG